MQIINGDCLHVLRTMPDNSVDAVITDPPYGLSNTSPDKVTETIVRWAQGDREYVPKGKGFMGAEWDGFVPPPAVWDECYRVLKPGGHMAVFAGTRTQDLMGIGIRFAGFDIRENLAWITGQGFPKSQNVSKSPLFCQCEKVESKHGNGELLGVRESVRDARGMVEAGEAPDVLPAVQRGCAGPGLGHARAQGAGGTEDVYPDDRCGESRLEGRGDLPSREGELRGSPVREVPGGVVDDGPEGRVHHGAPAGHGPVGRSSVAADRSGEPQESRSPGQSAGEPGIVSLERGSQTRGSRTLCGRCGKPVCAEGLGTALKPSHEPIILARKPFSSTVAANVTEWGTGAINIDACRVTPLTEAEIARSGKSTNGGVYGKFDSVDWKRDGAPTQGRFPANVVLDRDQATALDQQSGTLKSGSRKAGTYRGLGYMGSDATEYPEVEGNEGGASRFFHVADDDLDADACPDCEDEFNDPTVDLDARFRYAAKAPKKERPTYEGEDGNQVQHPTVKPLKLLAWLVRLITPPGGTVLDPFAGSGTTVEAALLEGFNPVAIEAHGPYIRLIEQRVERATEAQTRLDVA